MLAALATAVALALAAPQAAGATPASSAGFITVRHGDLVAVKGARLGCIVQLPGVVCYPSRSGKPRIGAYAVTLMSPGIAAIAKIGPGLDLKPVVTKVARGVKLHARDRVPQAAARTVRLGIGQVIRLRPPAPGKPIDCAVVRSAGLPTLYCSLDDARGPVVGSFAVVVNEKTSALGKIEADRSTTVTNVRRQPAG